DVRVRPTAVRRSRRQKNDPAQLRCYPELQVAGGNQMHRRLTLLLFLVSSRGTRATEYVIDVRDEFRLQLADGGLSGYTDYFGPIPLPGTDQGLVNGSDLGYDNDSTRYGLVQLGGPDAGQIIREMPGDRRSYLHFAFRARIGTAAPQIWLWSPLNYLARLDTD